MCNIPSLKTHLRGSANPIRVRAPRGIFLWASLFSTRECEQFSCFGRTPLRNSFLCLQLNFAHIFISVYVVCWTKKNQSSAILVINRQILRLCPLRIGINFYYFRVFLNGHFVTYLPHSVWYFLQILRKNCASVAEASLELGRAPSMSWSPEAARCKQCHKRKSAHRKYRNIIIIEEVNQGRTNRFGKEIVSWEIFRIIPGGKMKACKWNFQNVSQISVWSASRKISKYWNSGRVTNFPGSQLNHPIPPYNFVEL